MEVEVCKQIVLEVAKHHQVFALFVKLDHCSKMTLKTKNTSVKAINAVASGGGKVGSCLKLSPSRKETCFYRTLDGIRQTKEIIFQ